MRARAFPLPVGHEQRVLPAAEEWLQQLLEEGELSRWMTGDGTPAGPRIYIWQATGPRDLPGTLAELLTGHDVTPVPVSPDLGQEWARGRQGDHPFTTSYAHTFAQPLDADGRVARIPVPGIGGGAPPRSQVSGTGGLPDDYRSLVEAVAAAAAETGGPVTCVMAAQRADIDVTGRQSENVRAKLKRLEDRGWLRRTAAGKFAIAP